MWSLLPKSSTLSLHNYILYFQVITEAVHVQYVTSMQVFTYDVCCFLAHKKLCGMLPLIHASADVFVVQCGSLKAAL